MSEGAEAEDDFSPDALESFWTAEGIAGAGD